MPYLRIEGLNKRFGMVQAVRDVSLRMEKGTFLTLLGPSGCGKTTILRCVAGIETPDAGTIEVNGRVLFAGAKGIEVPSYARKLAMVFQSYALWPHMTVAENVSYGLRQAGVDRGETKAKVEAALELLQLDGLDTRYPAQLSGGQQQRVALARAIVYDSELVLLDEPLSNLDTRLRDLARLELKRLQRKLGLTMIYVTHSQSEALAMSHQIAVMRAGEIQQVGAPREIYERPVNSFVADFVGTANIFSATVISMADGEGELEAGGVRLRLSASAVRLANGQQLTAVVRPEDVRLSARAPSGAANVWPGRLEESEYLGESLMCVVSVGSLRLRARGEKWLSADSPNLYVTIDPASIRLVQEDQPDQLAGEQPVERRSVSGLHS